MARRPHREIDCTTPAQKGKLPALKFQGCRDLVVNVLIQVLHINVARTALPEAGVSLTPHDTSGLTLMKLKPRILERQEKR